MNTNNIDQLTILRFIAAFLVVIFHYGINIPPFNYSFILPIISKGPVFVSFFFVLSGYVLTITYYHKQVNVKDFYLRRFCRIYPIFFVSILFTLLVFFLSARSFPPLDPLIQLSLMNAWLPKYSLAFNYVGWSISVEFFFYLLFPFLLRWVRKISRYNLVIIVTVFWVINQYLTIRMINENWTESIFNLVSFHPLFHLNEFLIGIVGGVIYVVNNKHSAQHKVYFVGSCILFLILIQFDYAGTYFRNGLYAPIFITIIYFASTGLIMSNVQNKNRYFILLGESSYSLYILQMPVFILLTVILNDFSISQPILFFFLYLLTLITSSIVTYTQIEVPSKRILLNLFQKGSIS